MKGVQIAIVGGPSTGKTTLIKALEAKGYSIINETSRELMEQQASIGGKILPGINRDVFQKELLKMNLKRRKESQNEKLVFSDTSIACGIAYYLADNLEAPEEFWTASKENPYNLVFLLDFLSAYEKDGLRIETKDKSTQVHNYIKQVHEKLNHKIIVIPAVEVESRIKMIEDAIRKEFKGILEFKNN